MERVLSRKGLGKYHQTTRASHASAISWVSEAAAGLHSMSHQPANDCCCSHREGSRVFKKRVISEIARNRYSSCTELPQKSAAISDCILWWGSVAVDGRPACPISASGSRE